MASRLWAQQGFPIQPTFEKSLADNYHAPLTLLDFVANAEGARHEINRWTAQHTKDRIKQVIGPGLLRKLEVAIPAPVEIDAAELYVLASTAHAQMSYEDLTQLQAVSLFMVQRPGETLLDCHGLLTSDQRRAISRYARAAGEAQLVPTHTPTGIFL